MIQFITGGSQAFQAMPEAADCAAKDGVFNLLLNRQMDAAKQAKDGVVEPKASAPPEAENGENAARRTQRHTIDRADLIPPEENAQKDSKCDSSQTDVLEYGIVGILEGIGLLGLRDQQEPPADGIGVAATDGMAQPPQVNGESWNISARMPETDAAQEMGAGEGAQATQAGEAACSLENISSVAQDKGAGEQTQPTLPEQARAVEDAGVPTHSGQTPVQAYGGGAQTEGTLAQPENPALGAQAGQSGAKEVERLSAAFNEVMSRAAGDRPNAKETAVLEQAAAVVHTIQANEEQTGEEQANGSFDAMPNPDKDESVETKPAQNAPQGAFSLEGATARTAAQAGEAAAATGEVVQEQQVQENLNDIVESVSIHSADDVQEFEITLRPEHLGKLKINLVKDGTGISVALDAKDDKVRQMLQPQMEELQQLLKEKGVPVTRVEVVPEQFAAADGRNARQDTSWQQNRGERANAQRRTTAGRSERAGVAAAGLYSPAERAPAALRSPYSSVEFQA